MISVIFKTSKDLFSKAAKIQSKSTTSRSDALFA
jgi:hypothetical protein